MAEVAEHRVRPCGLRSSSFAVPDGRSVTILLNATPILAEEGTKWSPLS